jgi:soluble lytic murein transglycosylase-like protein
MLFRTQILLVTVAFCVTGAQAQQQEQAEAAMAASLAAQQAAVNAFRGKGEPDSVRQQRESVIRQTGAVGAPLAWASPAPLAVPNVQMMDDSCQAMEQGQIDKLIQASAKKQGIAPELLKSVMRQESAFKPCAVSTAGAMGLMQIMPETADMLGLDDPFDPAKNTDAGAQFLKMMLNRYQGDVPMALGAYNAGPGKVDKAGGVPPISETLQYVTNILRNLAFVY